VKIALFGHGGMGRVLEESARAAGHDVGAIFTSANVGEAARCSPGMPWQSIFPRPLPCRPTWQPLQPPASRWCKAPRVGSARRPQSGTLWKRAAPRWCTAPISRSG